MLGISGHSQRIAKMMAENLGISRDGIALADEVKRSYKTRQPLHVPSAHNRLLTPELLLNSDLHLDGFDDPLPLAVVAARDPETPMALAAATRLSPKAGRAKLVAGVLDVVGETSRHCEVTKLVESVRAADFCPQMLKRLQGHAGAYVARAREIYGRALKNNLQALLDGEIAPRAFVRQFFQLTESGNLRHEIRARLVASLLLSANVRPAIKFLFLENLYRLPTTVRTAITGRVLRSPDAPHTDQVKEEIRWILELERRNQLVH